MSRVITHSETWTGYPTNYLSDHQYYGASNQTNALAPTTSNTYANINLTRGSSAVTYWYVTFDTSSIPQNATITSCSGKIKCAISSTNSNYIKTRQAQFFSGTNAKGATVRVSTSTSVLSPNIGTWSRDELDDARVRFYAVRNTGSTNSSIYLRPYGADLTVNYTWDETIYSISTSSSADGVSINTSASEVVSGNSVTITTNAASLSNIIIEDNGTDITSNFTGASGNYSYTISNISADHTIALSDIVRYSVSVTSDEETLGAWVVYGDTWASYSYNIPQGKNCNVYIVGLDGEDTIDAPLNVSATDNGVDITNSIIYHAADDFLGIAYYEYSINNIQTAHTINLSYSSEPIASAYTVSVSTDYNYAFCSATVRYESGIHTVVVQPTQDIPVGDNCEVWINFGSDAPQTGYTLTDNGVDVTSSLVYVPQGGYEWSRPYYTYSLSSVRTAHTLVARYTGTTYTVSGTTTNENLWFISYDLDGGDYEEVHLPEASCKVNPGGGTTILIGGSNFNGLRVTDNGTDVTSSLVYFSAETFEDITYPDGYRYSISDIQANHTIVVSQTISENVVSAELADYYLFLYGIIRYNDSNAETQAVTAGDSCELRIYSSAVEGTTYQSVGITTLQPYIIVTDNGVDISSSLSYHSPQYASDQEYLYYTLSNVQIGHAFIITYTGTTYTLTASSTDSNHGIAFSGRIASASQYAIAYPGTNASVFISGSTSDIYLTDNGVDVTSSIVTSNVTYYPVNVIQTNHTIVLSLRPQNTLSMKTSGTWQTVTKAYKKSGNSWVEQSDLTNIFDTTTIYFNE